MMLFLRVLTLRSKLRGLGENVGGRVKFFKFVMQFTNTSFLYPAFPCAHNITTFFLLAYCFVFVVPQLVVSNFPPLLYVNLAIECYRSPTASFEYFKITRPPYPKILFPA